MENIKEIINEKIEYLGLSVYKIEYKENTLTIKLDGDDISIDNIVKATKIINPIIDELDPIKEKFVLDVCSKGEDE